jgi:thiamine biosynthesis protein ThiS
LKERETPLQIQVNGEPRDVPDSVTLGGLVRHLALAPERLAIELNHSVVRRADWPDTILKEGDRVEIVHFVGGGMKSGDK